MRGRRIAAIVTPVVLAGVVAFFVLANNKAKPLPEGLGPYDPKPLMQQLEQRTQTDKYRFAVVGDSKNEPPFALLLTKITSEIKPDFMLTTGDMVRTGGGKKGPGYWEHFAKTAGADMKLRPWWPAAGNHDVSTGGENNFKRFYNLDREYYSFTFRNALFIALPWQYTEGESLKWLEEELKKGAAEKKHIFAFNHMPFYTVGHKGNVPNKSVGAAALLEKYGARAVFSGHDHGYYRTMRNGVAYVISAGAGAGIAPAMRKDEALKEDVFYHKEPNTYRGQPLPEGFKVTHLNPLGTESKDNGERDKEEQAEAKNDSGNKPLYWYHNGVTGVERVTDEPDLLAVVVDVDGASVKLSCVTYRGETLDEVVLSK
ncbi:MAG TPA: metallophosphoesterase [Planctomycetota bacterium]|jgi:hypothetical protein